MALVTNLDTAVPPKPTGRYLTSIASFLRSDNTTAYTALDVIGDGSGESGALEFPGVTRSGAILTVSITNRLETDTITPRLWLFDTEPTNFSVNDAFALVTADVPKLLGVWDFVDADKITVGTLINFYVQTDQSDHATGGRNIGPVPYTNASGSLYGLLQTVSGYTPIALTQWTIKIGVDIA